MGLAAHLLVEIGDADGRKADVLHVAVAELRAVVKEREQNGLYQNLENFIERTLKLKVNSRVFESLIKAGAFDCFGVTRKQMMNVYIQILDRTKKTAHSNMAIQTICYPDIGEYDKGMKLAFEKEALGIYVSGHPLEDFRGLWNRHTDVKASDFMLNEETGEPAVADNRECTSGGLIAAVKIISTKKKSGHGLCDAGGSHWELGGRCFSEGV